ncbi:hypothetical protein MRX96_031772 [Rhipicephalus microplus]
MAEGRRSSRSHKTVNYAKLDYGSEEDDDFKPTEAPPSKRPKPAVKEAPKKAEKKTKPDSDASSSTVSQKQKTGRASLDEKLFQRDLEAALRLSQNGSASEGQCQKNANEGKPADIVIEQNNVAGFPETLELAGEVVVQSEPAPETSEPSASPGDKEEEDYQPEQEDSSEGEEDEEGCIGRRLQRQSFQPLLRNEPLPQEQGPGKLPPALAAPPQATTKNTSTTRNKAQASSALASLATAAPPVARTASRLTSAPKPTPCVDSRPLPQRAAPAGGVPMTVPKFSSGHLPASGIRLGLSRRSVSKPLHSFVKVQQ